MLAARLSLALDEGAFNLPDTGAIAVVAPARDADLSALPRDRTTVITRHFPVHHHFSALGYAVETTARGPYALTVICLPRAKAEARALVAELAPRTDGPLVIDGQKTDGIESLLKDLRKLGDTGAPVVKAHGKLFAYRGAVPENWRAGPQSVSDGGRSFQTAPGVFSADGIDPGSAALAAHMPRDLKGRVIDLGAGWGYLSARALTHQKVTAIDLVEADHLALEAARANITDDRATFHWADALSYQAAPADHVITNPPFHTGRAADPALGQGFIRAAARLLRPKGRLWLVANRHLPYEQTLESHFNTVTPLAEQAGFKVTLAQAPRKSRKG